MLFFSTTKNRIFIIYFNIYFFSQNSTVVLVYPLNSFLYAFGMSVTWFLLFLVRSFLNKCLVVTAVWTYVGVKHSKAVWDLSECRNLIFTYIYIFPWWPISPEKVPPTLCQWRWGPGYKVLKVLLEKHLTFSETTWSLVPLIPTWTLSCTQCFWVKGVPGSNAP